MKPCLSHTESVVGLELMTPLGEVRSADVVIDYSRSAGM